MPRERFASVVCAAWIVCMHGNVVSWARVEVGETATTSGAALSANSEHSRLDWEWVWKKMKWGLYHRGRTACTTAWRHGRPFAGSSLSHPGMLLYFGCLDKKIHLPFRRRACIASMVSTATLCMQTAGT